MTTQIEDQEQVTQELGVIETRIRAIIYEVYDCCFAGPIRIIPLKTVGYQILLGMPSIEKPISFAAELEGEDFFKYMKELLREASLSYIKHFSIQLELIDIQGIPGQNNVFKISLPKNNFGGNIETIVPNIPNIPNIPFPSEPSRPTQTPQIIQNTGSNTRTSDWFGTQEEFNQLTRTNPNINYYIYEEVAD